MGRINILNKSKLKLSRNDFIDTNLIRRVLREFELNLIKKIIEKWKNVDVKNKFLTYNHFCSEFIDTYNLGLIKNDLEFTNLLKELLYFKVYLDGEFRYINSKTFLSNYKKFIILPIKRIFKQIKNLKIVRQISIENNIPILFTDYFMVDYHSFLIFNKNTHLELSTEPFFPCLIVNIKDKIIDRKKLDRFEVIKFKTNWIYARFTYKYQFLNENHPIVKFWIKNIQSFNENNILRELFNHFLENLSDFGSSSVVNINRILKKINEILNTDFKLIDNDLPMWILKDYISGELD